MFCADHSVSVTSYLRTSSVSDHWVISGCLLMSTNHNEYFIRSDLRLSTNFCRKVVRIGTAELKNTQIATAKLSFKKLSKFSLQECRINISSRSHQPWMWPIYLDFKFPLIRWGKIFLCWFDFPDDYGHLWFLLFKFFAHNLWLFYLINLDIWWSHCKWMLYVCWLGFRLSLDLLCNLKYDTVSWVVHLYSNRKSLPDEVCSGILHTSGCT